MSPQSSVRWLGHSTHLGVRKAGLPLPECGLEQFLSLSLSSTRKLILIQGTVWLSDQGGREIQGITRVDTLVPLERGFTNMYYSLNNERNRVYYGMHHYINNKLQLRVVRTQTTFGCPAPPSACPLT